MGTSKHVIILNSYYLLHWFTEPPKKLNLYFKLRMETQELKDIRDKLMASKFDVG